MRQLFFDLFFKKNKIDYNVLVFSCLLAMKIGWVVIMEFEFQLIGHHQFAHCLLSNY
jgi:hypothetical protein